MTTVPGEYLQFPPAEMRRHAGSVEAIADAVRDARAAVHAVTMDTEAYGQLCQFAGHSESAVSTNSLVAPVHDSTT
jgi:hypothetical protein